MWTAGIRLGDQLGEQGSELLGSVKFRALTTWAAIRVTIGVSDGN
jgi:hypothetical protein